MKCYKITAAVIFLVALVHTAPAQDRRTVKTKVADILANLPTDDNAQAERLFIDLSNLGEEGIRTVTDQVQPNGDPDGVPYRFAVSLLTHYATNPLQKAEIEKVYLYALATASRTEVKAYFIDNLKWIGSDASVKTLTSAIADPGLCSQAISALQIIGSSAARQALLDALSNARPFAKAKLLQALGELRFSDARPLITKAASDGDPGIKKQALWSLALLADPASSNDLLGPARSAAFKDDPSGATEALLEYVWRIKDPKITTPLIKEILKGTPALSQQHYRLAALEVLSKSDRSAFEKVQLKEYVRFDDQYRKEVLNIVSPLAEDPAILKVWEKEYKKSNGDIQAEILSMLAQHNQNDAFTSRMLLPALSADHPVRIVAAREIAANRNKKFAADLVAYLSRCTDDEELALAKSDVLQLIDKDNAVLVSQMLPDAVPKSKIVLLQILSERRAQSSFEVVLGMTGSPDVTVRAAAWSALPHVTSGSNVPVLLTKLGATDNPDDVQAIQAALIAAVNASSIPQINAAYPKQTIKLLPVLPYLNDAGALAKVVAVFSNGSPPERQIAFDALQAWQDKNAIRTLLKIGRDPDYAAFRTQALTSGVKQVSLSGLPDDEKLLLLKEFMAMAQDKAGKILVLRTAGNVRTFLSLVFVAAYLDDPDVGSAASRAAMQLSLPTADARPGMTGSFVRATLERIQARLIGEDSQYEKIDVTTYLGKLLFTKGYEAIFNGTDFSGWHAAVEIPVVRSKAKKDIAAKKQKDPDAGTGDNWAVKDGMITSMGTGANLATLRTYGDFEMLVDWKISRNEDGGIYIRGARVDAGANDIQKEYGSAANPPGEWNTFRINVAGDRVAVVLNGVLVIDNVVMQNDQDKTLPLRPQGEIELQARGAGVSFRNVYVKEPANSVWSLSDGEKKEGFELLFDGKDLNQWNGNKTDYIVEDNAIAIYPAKESHGNLATAKEYSNFVFRFEFQLTPGANNGIGIHAPMEGDAAYVGKEIQVLDDTAPVYAKLESWQYHGSVYGIIAAKRGYLKPVGDWNQEEIEVKGDHIKVTLNGTVITDGDISAVTKNGTLDHKEHPGIQRHKGPIQFLGHGTVVRFRNIRVKEMTAN